MIEETVRRPAAQGALGRRLVHPAAAPEWLTYAALDVELLVELRDALAAELDAQGKREWAAAGVRRPGRRRRGAASGRGRTRGGAPPASTRCAPAAGSAWWRRSGTPGTRIAQRLDRAPGKILPDAAISEVAESAHAGPDALRQVPAFCRRQAKRFEADWLSAIGAAEQLPETELPALHLACDGPPQTRVCGRPRTRRRPRGWPRSARRWPPGPRSSSCPWRTSSPPSTSVG